MTTLREAVTRPVPTTIREVLAYVAAGYMDAEMASFSVINTSYWTWVRFIMSKGRRRPLKTLLMVARTTWRWPRLDMWERRAFIFYPFFVGYTMAIQAERET